MRARGTGEGKDQASKRRFSNVESKISVQGSPNWVYGKAALLHVFPEHFSFHNSTLEYSVVLFCNLMNEVGG
jgi:hypothetical protein